jgi:nitroreductase
MCGLTTAPKCHAAAMELAHAIRTRRMCRTYDPDRPISREVLSGLLNLGIRAPSAGHTQGWRFLILDDITSVSAFWTATTRPGDANRWLDRLRSAPVLIICYSDKQAYLDRYAESDKGWTDRDEGRWRVPYWDTDTAMAAMLILLAAHDAGLGALFFGIDATAVPAVAGAFAVPDGLNPIGVISLGYPAPDVRSPSLRRGRRTVDDVVSYGSFADPSS